MPFTPSPPGGQYAWWNLERAKKRALQAKRRAGLYGGETAAQVGRAPYFWAQEYGNDAAAIQGQGFAKESWEAFTRRVYAVVSKELDSLMGR